MATMRCQNRCLQTRPPCSPSRCDFCTTAALRGSDRCWTCATHARTLHVRSCVPVQCAYHGVQTIIHLVKSASQPSSGRSSPCVSKVRRPTMILPCPREQLHRRSVLRDATRSRGVASRKPRRTSGTRSPQCVHLRMQLLLHETDVLHVCVCVCVCACVRACAACAVCVLRVLCDCVCARAGVCVCLHALRAV